MFISEYTVVNVAWFINFNSFASFDTYEYCANVLHLIHEYLYPVVLRQSWLCVARGSAAVLNMNCAAVLLPLCHCLVLTLHRTAVKVCFVRLFNCLFYNTRRFNIHLAISRRSNNFFLF